MRSRVHIHTLVVVVLFAVFCVACNSEPTAAFTADKTTIVAGESVQFTDESVNDPTTWLWSFEGSTPSSSPSRSPLVAFYTPGTFSVTLEVRKRGASNIMTKDNYITVEPANTDLTFINNTYTDVFISLEGVVKTVASGDQVTYFDIDANSVNYHAETSGKTGQGNQVGLLLSWDYTIQLTGGAQDYELDIGTDFFFLFITNNGTHNLSPLVVDHGAAEPLTEDIFIPTDDVKYRIGYYTAWESAEIRAYYDDQPDSWTYWKANEHFSYPGEWNQNISLENPFKKGAEIIGRTNPVAEEERNLLPATNFIPRKTIKEGTIRHFPNRN